MEKVEDLGGEEEVTGGEESLVSLSHPTTTLSPAFSVYCAFARAPSELRRLLVSSFESGKEVHPQEVHLLGD